MSRTLRDSSGAMTAKCGFSVVAAISVIQRFSTAGQQGILLGLGEAVDLVDEQHRLPAAGAQGAARVVDDQADVLDAGGDGGELDEGPIGGLRHQVGQGRLARAGRTPQED